MRFRKYYFKDLPLCLEFTLDTFLLEDSILIVFWEENTLLTQCSFLEHTSGSVYEGMIFNFSVFLEFYHIFLLPTLERFLGDLSFLSIFVFVFQISNYSAHFIWFTEHKLSLLFVPHHFLLASEKILIILCYDKSIDIRGRNLAIILNASLDTWVVLLSSNVLWCILEIYHLTLLYLLSFPLNHVFLISLRYDNLWFIIHIFIVLVFFLRFIHFLH